MSQAGHTDITQQASKDLILGCDQLRSHLTGLFAAAGLGEQDAFVVSENLVEAEARGVCSHGLIMVPVYVQRLLSGGIRTDFAIRTVHENGCCLVLDADGAPGQVALAEGMRRATEICDRFGVAHVWVQGNNHVGMLASYVEEPVRRGYTAVVMTNTGPSVRVPGGSGRRMGNNAICFASPGDPDPLIVDMATGTVACGKIRLAGLRNEQVPDHWISGPGGEPSTNPADLDGGGSVDFSGGHKGYCLAFAIDLLAALVAGSSPSPKVINQRPNPTRTAGTSQYVFLVNAQAATGVGDLAARVGEFCREVRATSPNDEARPVLCPGDPELSARRVSEDSGIRIGSAVAGLVDEAAASVKYHSLRSKWEC